MSIYIKRESIWGLSSLFLSSAPRCWVRSLAPLLTFMPGNQYQTGKSSDDEIHIPVCTTEPTTQCPVSSTCLSPLKLDPAPIWVFQMRPSDHWLMPPSRRQWNSGSQQANLRTVKGTAALCWNCSASKDEALSAREGVGERKPSDTDGGNVNWRRHCRKQYGASSRNCHVILQSHPWAHIWRKH